MSIPSPKTVVIVNASGRQSASFARVADAVGWHVRAQMKDREGTVATEISGKKNVEVIEGLLTDSNIIAQLFEGNPDVAFINTVHLGGNEVAIGKALVDAAKEAGVKHLVFSSLTDHHAIDPSLKTLPMWAAKGEIERYIRDSQIPTTFIYTGIYHNNFTTLPYPLFELELLDDDSFEWKAPFPPDKRLPWLDAEHDVGAVVLQILVDGPHKWANKRIPLAFQYLTPNEVCDILSLSIGRPVSYVQGPITVKIDVPEGYEEHLDVFTETLCEKNASYFGPELEAMGTDLARQLWAAPRSLAEYAKEAFFTEEYANGRRWFKDDESDEEDPGLYNLGA